MAIVKEIPARAVIKLYEFKVMHKGFQIPVTVYLVEEKRDVFYNHCVCFEKTPIETFLQIDKNKGREWFDLFDREDQLAGAIGKMIDAELDKTLAYKMAAN